MFEINEYIICGSNGVCRVADVGTPKMERINSDRLYYSLEPLYKPGSVIYTPVDNEKITMRYVLTREATHELVDAIPDMEAIWVVDDKKREKEYKTILKQYDCYEWMKMLKNLYLTKKRRHSEGRKFSNMDEKCLKIVEECLYGELAISLEMTREEVGNFLLEKVLGAELDREAEELLDLV